MPPTHGIQLIALVTEHISLVLLVQRLPVIQRQLKNQLNWGPAPLAYATSQWCQGFLNEITLLHLADGAYSLAAVNGFGFLSIYMHWVRRGRAAAPAVGAGLCANTDRAYDTVCQGQGLLEQNFRCCRRHSHSQKQVSLKAEDITLHYITGACHIIRISSKSWFMSVIPFKKWNLYIILIHYTQTDIFQMFISFNFDDYYWQLMKIPNSVWKVWTWKVWACTALNT